MIRGLTLAALLLLIPLSAAAQEIRGFWADGFSEGFKTPQQVDLLLERLRKANCNAVFAQMRKSADAYYQSRYDPWAADNPERFDALAYLIEKAHSGTPRIAVHAWLNTFAVGKDRGNPLHVTRTHPEWLSISDTGETHDGEAAKLDPGHPDAADYTFRIYMDVVRHYDVDGIHFDFVRYGGPRWGYNPVSVARFNARYGRQGQPAPEDPLWKQWRRDQVTALVRKVYVMATALKPGIQVSAATITWSEGPRNLREWNEKSAAMNRVFQDWRSWMREGILDLNCAMSYYRESKHAAWFRRWLEFIKDNQFGRWAVPAAGAWLNPIPDTAAQIAEIRRPSRRGHRARGVMLYCYAATNQGAGGEEERFNPAFYESLSAPSAYCSVPPFSAAAPYPAIPWKQNPRSGVLRGFVLRRADLAPVDGARIVVSGRGTRRRLVSDGTGFWAAVGLPPGRYNVRIEAPASPPIVRSETVGRGQSVEVNTLADSEAAAEADASMGQAGSRIVGERAVVVAGTDRLPDTLIVRSLDSEAGRHIPVRLADSTGLRLQAGDEVLVSGTVVEREGVRWLEDAAARWIGVGQRRAMTVAGRSSELLNGGPVPARARLTGRVAAVNPSGFTLDDGRPVQVILGERRGPGIEDETTRVNAPRAGSEVRVTGVPVASTADDAARLVLWPISASDLEVLADGEPNPSLTLLIGLCAAALITGLVALVRPGRRAAGS